MARKKRKKFSKQAINIREFIYPLFVKEGRRIREEIPSMPGVFRFSVDTIAEEVSRLHEMGLMNVLIFGVPDVKNWKGTYAYQPENIVSKTVHLIKERFPAITLMTDVCLCAYTVHGHCGVIKKGKKSIDNAATLRALSDMALSHAQAGADFVAPSAMSKNQVAAIRKNLDEHGYKRTKVMGYSAKFASNFYGPFRDIAHSAPQFGNRGGYQLDYIDRKSALVKIEQDIKQGADIVMVKPALGYLDIIYEAKRKFNYPLAAYNVSGEYSMIKNGARLGFWDERLIVFEIMHSIKRAGADFIITYHAKDIAQWLGG